MYRQLRRILRWIPIYLLYGTGLLSWAERRIISSSGIIVLTFHRVLDETELQQSCSQPGMLIRRSTFEKLLQFLRARCAVVSFSQLPPSWDQGLDRPRVAVTFDDGWKDTSDTAYPICRKYQVPITVFVCPTMTGKSLPFWPERVLRVWRASLHSPELRQRLRAVYIEAGGPEAAEAVQNNSEALVTWLKILPDKERERVVREIESLTAGDDGSIPASDVDSTMTWHDAARIAADGGLIGSHTNHHLILTHSVLSDVRAELADSKEAIEKALGRPCSAFAYPNGSWSRAVRDLTAEHGYDHAFINEAGVWTSDTDPYLIPRVNIWEGSVVGPLGQFSAIAFRYSVLWHCYRSERRKRSNSAQEPSKSDLHVAKVAGS